MTSRLSLCALFALINCVVGANILYLNGVPSPSHHLYNRVLVLGLAAKGHNVTFLSSDVVTKDVPNVHYIHLEKVYETFYGGEQPIEIIDLANQTPYEAIVDMPNFFLIVCQGVLLSTGLDKILDYPSNFFDLIVYDFTFGPCLIPLVAKFNNPPLVSVTAFANPPYTVDLIGGQKYPAYVPHYTVNYPSDMTFSQRVFNTYLHILDAM